MRIIVNTVICLLIFCAEVNAEDNNMKEQEAQKTWEEYHERIKSHGITSEHDLVLDFSFFTQDEIGAKGIKTQLSENYEISISKEGEYWLIKGTTRPYAINLSQEQHIGWVKFMHDVALSYGCIFSTWTIIEPETKQAWSNENIETGLE